MAVEILTTFQFKRGTAQRWIEVNPILKQGEPGFEYDTGKLKLGDGVRHWLELDYVNSGKEEIVSVETFADLSAIGNPNMIYKVNSEKTLYQWNATESKYEPLGGSSFDPNSINLINGGNANG